MNTFFSTRVSAVIYWITTSIAFAAFAIPGAANLARVPHIAQDMAHLGYPAYFMTILGACKLLGAVTILIPRFARLKEWAYAGMIFDLGGASLSRAMVGDSALLISVPLVIGAVVVVSWRLRPSDRVLTSEPFVI